MGWFCTRQKGCKHLIWKARSVFSSPLGFICLDSSPPIKGKQGQWHERNCPKKHHLFAEILSWKYSTEVLTVQWSCQQHQLKHARRFSENTITALHHTVSRLQSEQFRLTKAKIHLSPSRKGNIYCFFICFCYTVPLFYVSTHRGFHLAVKRT